MRYLILVSHKAHKVPKVPKAIRAIPGPPGHKVLRALKATQARTLPYISVRPQLATPERRQAFTTRGRIVTPYLTLRYQEAILAQPVLLGLPDRQVLKDQLGLRDLKGRREPLKASMLTAYQQVVTRIHFTW